MLKGFASLLVSILVVSVSAAEKKFTPLDLSAHVQKRWSDIEPNTSWASVPAGLQDFGGVPFKADGIVEVTGMGAAQAGQPKPAQVTEIAAGAKATHIHILHGTGWDAPDGTPIAVLTLNYANGESRSMPIQYGVHARNWWQEPHEATAAISDTNSEVAWTGGSPETDPRGVKLRLFRTAFVNPLPQQEIRTIDFVSLFSRATPVMLGLALEHGRPGDLAEAERLAAKAKEYLETLRTGVTIEVRLANSNDKAINPNARGRITVNNRPIDLGTFRGNASGQVRIYFPELAESLDYSVHGDGFVSHHGMLNLLDDVLNTPIQVTVQRGTTIGGNVQTESGRPISGAKVAISAITRDAVGQFISEQIAQVETDATGNWKSSSVPADFSFLSFAVRHPEYRSGDYEQGDEADEGIVTKSDLLARKAVMPLKPAPAIAGMVKDTDGKAIADAAVSVRMDERSALHATSDAKGAFRVVLPDVAEVNLIVEARGLAPVKQRVELVENQTPVEITLHKGNILKGRVLDQTGAALEGVAVSVISWNELPILNWRAETDAEGRFTWESAPAEPVVLSFRKAGYQQHSGTYSASDKEIEVQVGKTFQLSGTVVDAETKEPIASFRIVPGMAWGGMEDSTQWQMDDAQRGSNGKFLVDNVPMQGSEMRFMIQAEGYQPVASPSYPPVGWHTFDAALKKGERPAGIVKNKEGKPVQYVQIVTLGSDHVMLSAGKFRSYNRNRNYDETDSEGLFRLEEALGNARVIFVHEEHGYAERTIDSLRAGGEIVLQPWARIEGQLKIGSKNAGAGHELMLSPPSHGPGSLQYDYQTYKKVTDENGRFSYDFVPPGERMLVRLIPIDRGSGWSHYTRFTIAPGETKQVQVGGTGLPIIGKLAASDPNREIKWNSGHHSLSKRFPKPPRFNSQEEYKEWMKSPEVVEAQRDPRNYTLEVAEDGSFRISDVLPGDYTLRINLMEPSDEQGFNQKMIASLSQDVTVEEIPGGQTDEPLDLGTLTIQLKNDLRTGMMAPPIEAKTLEDEPFALKELRGKYVLLDFWATWCGPCVAEIPNLKTAFEKHGKNPNFVMIGLSLDQEIKEPREFVKKRNLPWTQVFLGEWSQTKIPDRYGVTGIPATFLIDPQGRVIEMNLRGENLVRVLDRILTQTASAK